MATMCDAFLPDGISKSPGLSLLCLMNQLLGRKSDTDHLTV